MKLYNCKVRLHGDVRDEVRKKNVTAGEIRLLQRIHGDDAVLEILLNGDEARNADPSANGALRTEQEERERLERIYGELAVAKLYGVKQVSVSAPLPDQSVEEVVELDDTPKMRTIKRRINAPSEELVS